jgi:hypothetical protein
MKLLPRLTKALTIARLDIRQGRFQRSMALVTALSAVVSGFEAWAQHQRGDFDDPWMWTPVWLTPPTAAAGLSAIVSKKAARSVLPATSLVSVLDGIIGFGLHIRGVRRLPGGFKLGQYNLVMGPPIFAPLLVGIVGITGLIASMLRRETPHPTPRPIARLSGIRRTLPPPLWGRVGVGGAESDIEHGRFQQGMALTSAFFAIIAGGEAYFEHLRGSYNQKVMWTPIAVTPPMVGAAIGSAFSRRIATRVLPFAAMVTFMDGVLGFVLHLRGIYRMPGRFNNMRFNITMGPPLFAPLLFTAVGLLGMTASLLRRAPTSILPRKRGRRF